jgi:hypothetical protein
LDAGETASGLTTNGRESAIISQMNFFHFLQQNISKFIETVLEGAHNRGVAFDHVQKTRSLS